MSPHFNPQSLKGYLGSPPIGKRFWIRTESVVTLLMVLALHRLSRSLPSLSAWPPAGKLLFCIDKEPP